MRRIMSLEKQLEEKAKRWFLKAQEPKNRNMAKVFFEKNKKEVIKEYLEEHPKVKEEYIEKKAKQLKVKKGILLGAITLGTVAGVFMYTAEEEPYVEPAGQEQVDENKELEENEQNEEIEEKIEEEIVQEEKNEENNEPEIENKEMYDNFFASARSIDNRYDRDALITQKTKEIIVEAYNKRNPEKPITKDSLKYYILNEFVLEKTDKLGNKTYERVPQNVQYEFTDTQRLVKNGEIYVFEVEGKTVAVFDKYGDVLPDKNVEKPDMTFKHMLGIIYSSGDLKEIYKYPSTEEEKQREEKDFMITANGLLNYKEETIKEAEQEK